MKSFSQGIVQYSRIIPAITDYLIISSILDRFGLPSPFRVFFNSLKLFFILFDDNISQQEKAKACANFILSTVCVMIGVVTGYWWIGLVYVVVWNILCSLG